MHRLNGKEFILNSDEIKFVESTPDTLITLRDGEKFMVKEAVQVVVQEVIEYKKKWLWTPLEPREKS